MSSAALYPDPQPILACTVSRDIEDFGLLIEDMEAAMGEHWGDLSFAEVAPFLRQPEAASLRFLAVAIDEDDVRNLAEIGQVIADAQAHGVKIILVAEEIEPTAMQQLLRHGGDEFLDYPLDKGALDAAISRLTQGEQDPTEPPAPAVLHLSEAQRLDTDDGAPTAEDETPAPAAQEPELTTPTSVEQETNDDDTLDRILRAAALDDRDAEPASDPAAPEPQAPPEAPSLNAPETATPKAEAPTLPEPTPEPAPIRQEPPRTAPIHEGPAVPNRSGANGAVIAVQGMSGGCGASTLAVNLARELAGIDKKAPPRVCILDLDVQFGAVGSYLDLGPKAAVIELLSDAEVMDDESFRLALQPAEGGLMALTSPDDLIPLDFLSTHDIATLIDTARRQFDYVVIDMPRTIVDWSETVLTAADVFYGVIELDLRTAQNYLRLRAALQAESLPVDKMRMVLNRAPKFTDLGGRARIKRMAETLGTDIQIQLPDGGKAVAQAADQGETLAQSMGKSPLRKAINGVATQLHDTWRSRANG